MKKQETEQLLESNFTEQDYENVEAIFTKNSSHVSTLVEFVTKKILPQLISKKSFLDIGAGPASITTHLSKHFLSTTIIEPNKKYYPLYKDNPYNLHAIDFQSSNLNTKYDFILCSQVLYHIELCAWEFFVKKIYDTICQNGLGVIIILAPKGSWHGLLSSINPTYPNSHHVEETLKKLNINYQIKTIRNIFHTSNYENFRKILHLFTIDDCFPKKGFKSLERKQQELIHQKINEYIDKICKTTDGNYRLIYEDDYIIFKK